MYSTLLAMLLMSQAVDVQVELVDPKKKPEEQPIVRMEQVIEKLPEKDEEPPAATKSQKQDAAKPTPGAPGQDPQPEEEMIGPPEGYVPHPFPIQVWKALKADVELYVVGSVEHPGVILAPERYLEFCALLNGGLGESNLRRVMSLFEQKQLRIVTKPVRVKVLEFIAYPGLPGVQVEFLGGVLRGQVFTVPIFMVNDFVSRGTAELKKTVARRKERGIRNRARARANAIDLPSLMMRYAAVNAPQPINVNEMVFRLSGRR